MVDQALALSRGLGYDMNTVEFAISDGVPYAIDFTNAAPDFDVASLGEWHFNWVLDAMADYVIQQAHAAPFPEARVMAKARPMHPTQQAVDRYHELLAQEDVSALWEGFKGRMQENLLAFGDRPICNVLRPYFLHPKNTTSSPRPQTG